MENLEELQAAILRNKQATGKMAGLDEQYSRAAALRDTAAPEINRHGTVSPLQIIGNSMRQGRGQRDLRKIAPQREQARTDIAEGEAAAANNALALTMAKEGRDITKAGEATQKIADDAAQLEIDNALKDRKQQEKEDQMGGDSLVYTDGSKGPKGKMAVTTDVNGNLVQAAGPNRGQPVPEGWYEDESGSYRGFGQRGKAFSQNDIIKLNNEVQSVTNIRRNKEGFDNSFAKPAGVPTELAQKVVNSLASGDLLAEIPGAEKLDERTKESLQWFANWRMDFTTERRHELFGATLTPAEERSWKAAELIHPGMDAREIRKRIDELQLRAEESLLRRMNLSTASGLPANTEIMKRAAADLYGYDAEANMFSMPEADPAVAEAQAAAAEANWQPAPGNLEFYATLDEENQAAIQQIPDPVRRDAVLQAMRDRATAPPSVLPQATRGRGRN